MYTRAPHRAAVAIFTLAGGFAGLASAQTQTGNPIPVELPPAKPGCYHYSAGNGWGEVVCDTEAYINEHIPRPELLIGLGETTIKGKSPAPFVSNTIRVQLSGLGAETDLNPKTDLPEAGENAYSIQANVFFNNLAYTSVDKPRHKVILRQVKQGCP
jgi:hypothetical protein